MNGLSHPCELLAPAGSPESVHTALYFGADAIYVGGPQLQMRADSAGFSEQTLREAAELVHAAGKKLYVAANVFVKNREIPTLGDYAKRMVDCGADALIVSDIGALDTIKKAVPDMDIHISTQANCTNYAAANVYYNMGARRLVTAREMTLEEIAELRTRIPADMEIEAFVHGAMCMAYSGRCMISAFLNGRSGNRGDCTQPCRWRYHLVEQTRPGVFIPVEEDEHGSTILSSHDLNCIDLLELLAQAGVYSFKIEGRMKSPYYVATVVNAYRRRLDGTGTPEQLREELDCASHRPYCTGFYAGDLPKNHQNHGAYMATCRFMAAVTQPTENGCVTVQQRNRFGVGDRLEILSPHSLGLSFTVEYLTNSQGESVAVADQVEETVTVNCPYPLQPGDLLRRRDAE